MGSISEKDSQELEIILKYCKRIGKALEAFGERYETFKHNVVFQDACSLSIIQIGEAVNRLSDKFVESHPQIEWHNIYGMRCRLVHAYDMFDAEIVWDAIMTYVPVLQNFCEETTI